MEGLGDEERRVLCVTYPRRPTARIDERGGRCAAARPALPACLARGRCGRCGRKLLWSAASAASRRSLGLRSSLLSAHPQTRGVRRVRTLASLTPFVGSLLRVTEHCFLLSDSLVIAWCYFPESLAGSPGACSAEQADPPTSEPRLRECSTTPSSNLVLLNTKHVLGLLGSEN